MRSLKKFSALFVIFIIMPGVFFFQCAAPTADPLPSWSDGPKQSIIDFVDTVTTHGDAYVAPQDRIAVFDNDGTLWSEQPIYFQFAFAVDRVKELAPQHPEWRDEQPFKAILEGDLKTALAGGEAGIMKIVLATHTGMTTAEFETIVLNWIESARHPKTNRLYTDMVFQPMLELLDYLRANDFKSYIVSGGGIEFMRPWTERVYGIPPEQVIGSSLKLEFEMLDNGPVLRQLSEFDFFNDKEGKPVGIHKFIGKRPILAFGNSDGDLQMLQWTAAGDGARFMGIVHHTDAEREWAYDRESSIGHLDKALDEGVEKGWTIVDMKEDWNTIYPGN